MNVDLIEDALADAALEPAKHDQRTYFARTSCGTTRCLAGFIAERAGWVLWLDGDIACATRDGVTLHIAAAARDAAGLTYSQADFLFNASNMDSLKQLQARWEYVKAQHEQGKHPSWDWRPPQ